MSIPDTFSLILTPVIGLFTDRYGHRSHLLLMSSLLIASVHFTLAAASGHAGSWIIPGIPVFILGLSYSLSIITWSCIPILLCSLENEAASVSRVALGYGIATSLQNISLFLSPLLVGMLVAADMSYRTVEVHAITCKFLMFTES